MTRLEAADDKNEGRCGTDDRGRRGELAEDDEEVAGTDEKRPGRRARGEDTRRGSNETRRKPCLGRAGLEGSGAARSSENDGDNVGVDEREPVPNDATDAKRESCK